MRHIWVVMVALATASVLSAQPMASGGSNEKRRAVRFNGAGVAAINNDSSCDIGVYPAATLLLPYFQVDVPPARNRTTLISVTNVSPLPQIARVTIWSDWAYPVLTFNLFLTGYDVQPIDLYDVIVRGIIASPNGTSTTSPNARTTDGRLTNPNSGTQPATNLDNPNFLPSVVTDCGPGRLPGTLPANLVADVVKVLTLGTSSGVAVSCPTSDGHQAQVGSNHGGTVAVGYLTVDVVATCSSTNPTDLSYFTKELLFDNVLTGDYQDIQASAQTGNYAGGNPMVHIRAVPEGGGAGSVPTDVTPLPFTFYDRLTAGASDRRIDRRQPLPSAFSARWMSGSPAPFDTQYKFWREALVGPRPACDDYSLDDAIELVECIRFDERENAGIVGSGIILTFQPGPLSLRATDLQGVATSSIFPTLSTTDIGGWIYMNLSNRGLRSAYLGTRAPYSVFHPGYGAVAGQRDVSQNWVVISFFNEGKYGADLDATSLGNGCTPAPPQTDNPYNRIPGTYRIAPAGGVVVCPPGTKPTNGDASACHGTNVNP